MSYSGRRQEEEQDSPVVWTSKEHSPAAELLLPIIGACVFRKVEGVLLSISVGSSNSHIPAPLCGFASILPGTGASRPASSR
jgi:hypothetical protein